MGICHLDFAFFQSNPAAFELIAILFKNKPRFSVEFYNSIKDDEWKSLSTFIRVAKKPSRARSFSNLKNYVLDNFDNLNNFKALPFFLLSGPLCLAAFLKSEK